MTCFNVQASSASQNFMRTGNTGEHRKIPVQQNWKNSEHRKHRNFPLRRHPPTYKWPNNNRLKT